MFHSNTERLIDYWRSRRGTEQAPPRAAIDPADIPALLPQVLMLGRLGPGQYRVRLGGGFLAELHGRELRDTDFLNLWEPAARTPLQMALEAVRRHPEPLVIEAEARVGVGVMRLEIALAPLRGPTGQIDRLIGLYQPIAPAVALKGGVIGALRIVNIAAASRIGNSFPRLRLAAQGGRQIA